MFTFDLPWQDHRQNKYIKILPLLSLGGGSFLIEATVRRFYNKENIHFTFSLYSSYVYLS